MDRRGRSVTGKLSGGWALHKRSGSDAVLLYHSSTHAHNDLKQASTRGWIGPMLCTQRQFTSLLRKVTSIACLRGNRGRASASCTGFVEKSPCLAVPYEGRP